MKVSELIKILSKHDDNLDVVIAKNEIFARTINERDIKEVEGCLLLSNIYI